MRRLHHRLVRSLRHLPLLAILVGLGSAVGLADGRDDRGVDWSPVMYPAQQLPLIFSHARHLGRGTPCAACHAAATTSRSAVDNLLPTEAACRACHPIDRAEPERVVAGAPPARCAACHLGYAPGQPVARVIVTTPPLKFDHAAHVATPCATCHGDLTRVDLATRRQLPTMASCLTCHRAGAQQS
nr:cytochrome c3 family protein [Deltaproteobacteria bacterium]